MCLSLPSPATHHRKSHLVVNSSFLISKCCTFFMGNIFSFKNETFYWLSFYIYMPVCVCVCVCEYMRTRVCVCECEWELWQILLVHLKCSGRRQSWQLQLCTIWAWLFSPLWFQFCTRYTPPSFSSGGTVVFPLLGNYHLGKFRSLSLRRATRCNKLTGCPVYSQWSVSFRISKNPTEKRF